MNTNTKGFTLIELLVVIVIIGILSGIGISSFKSYQQKANSAKISAQIVQEKKYFLAECIGSGKQIKDCNVNYTVSHMPNSDNGSWRYGSSPAYCEEFCANRTNESLNQYARVATKEEAIWFAETSGDRCSAAWHYMNNSAQKFTSGYPMYTNQIVTNCGPINTGDIARFITWSNDIERENETSKSDCACVTYPKLN